MSDGKIMMKESLFAEAGKVVLLSAFLFGGTAFAGGTVSFDLFRCGAERADNWLRSTNVTVRTTADAIVARVGNSRHGWISYHLPVTDALRAQPVEYVVTLSNASDRVMAIKGRAEQLTAKGDTLPDDVVDRRFISYRIPAGKAMTLREPGYVESRAAELKLAFELLSQPSHVDGTGRTLAVSQMELNVKPDEPAPADWFAPGVKGEALRLDGDSAFWFNVYGQAVWGRGVREKHAGRRYFPRPGGTIEAWFKPDDFRSVRLLEASRHNKRESFRPPSERGTGVRLSLDAALEPGKWQKVTLVVTNGSDDVYQVYAGAGCIGAHLETDAERKCLGRVFFKGLVDELVLKDPDGTVCAHFTFDRTLLGSSDYGSRRIRGTFRRPSKWTEIFDRENFRTLPSDDDLTRGWFAHAVEREVRADEGRIAVNAPANLAMDFVEIENVGRDALVCPVVLNAGEVDVRGMSEIAETLGVGPTSPLSDREKADRIFQFLIRRTDYFMNHPVAFRPEVDKPYRAEHHALEQFVSYGMFECVPLNQLASTLFTQAGGLPSADCGGYWHGFEHVFYDGKARVYDLSARTAFPDATGDPQSLRELEDLPGPFFASGGSAECYIRSYFRRHYFEAPRFAFRCGETLAPGERIRFWRGNFGEMQTLCAGKYFDDFFKGLKPGVEVLPRTDRTAACGAQMTRPDGKVWQVDRFFPDYANAERLYEGAFPANGEWCVTSAYAVVAGRYRATDESGRTRPLELSTNGGAVWKPLAADAEGAVLLRDEIRGRAAFRLRAKGATWISARTVLETNRRLLTGELKAGANDLRFLCDAGSAARVRFGYRTPGAVEGRPEAVDAGTIRGFATHLVVRDGATASFGYETDRLSDGSEKTYTVLSAPGAKLVKGDWRLVRVGETVELPCSLEPGRWAVLFLDRFASHEPCPLADKAALVVGDAKVAWGRPINDAVMLHKQEYGVRGGRAAWKWDFPVYGKYPYMGLKTVDVASPGALRVRLTAALEEGPLEIGAVLLVRDPSPDFQAEIMKRICGMTRMPRESF